MAAVLRYLHAHVAKQLDEVVHVENVGHVVYGDRLAGEQRGAYHLQGFVFSPLRLYGTAERMSAFDDE